VFVKYSVDLFRDTILEILDLDMAPNALGSTKVPTQILAKLKNTMSDCHVAEKLFSKMLADYSADILPDIVSEYSTY
jgi:hypothetical protein